MSSGSQSGGNSVEAPANLRTAVQSWVMESTLPAETPVRTETPARAHLPINVHITGSTKRRLTHVGAAVVLMTSGALVAVHLSPEVGGALIAAGAQQLVAAILNDDAPRHYGPYTRTGPPASALSL